MDDKRYEAAQDIKSDRGIRISKSQDPRSPVKLELHGLHYQTQTKTHNPRSLKSQKGSSFFQFFLLVCFFALHPFVFLLWVFFLVLCTFSSA